MFIEVTRKFDDKKVMINVNHVDMIEPLPENDGYGREQSGCEIYFVYTKSSTKVSETYEELKKLLPKREVL